MGGVAFEVAFEGDALALGEEHLRFVSPPELARPLVVVKVDASVRSAGPREDPRRIDAGPDWVRTADAHVRWRREGHGRYAAEAELEAPYGLSHMTTALTGALVSAEGGVVLHAAAVVLEERAVLLIGPSGAGKTSAACLCGGTRWLAKDRVALLPTSAGWRAWGMPGGDDITLPQAPNRPLPVAAIARVRRADEAPSLRRLDPLRALVALRESTQTAGSEPALDAPAALAEAVPVYELRGRLDRPLTASLREALA